MSSQDIDCKKPEMKEMDTALDFLEHSGHVSSDVMQALRQVVVCMSSNKQNSQPANSLVAEGRDGPRSLPTTRKFKPASSKRQQLTAEEAAEIYMMRPTVSGKGARPKRGSMICCKTIAPKFGVSAKTIRDIWRGRTWVDATKPLWTEEEIERRAHGGGDHSDSEGDSEDQKPRKAQRTSQKSPELQPFQTTFQHPGTLDFCGGVSNFAMNSASFRSGPPISVNNHCQRPQDSGSFQPSCMPSNMQMLGMMSSFPPSTASAPPYQFDFHNFNPTHSMYGSGVSTGMPRNNCNNYHNQSCLADPSGMLLNSSHHNHLLHGSFPHFR